MCGRLFPKLDKLNNHSKICYKMSKLKFPGGFHQSPKTIFGKLEEIDSS